LPANEKAFDLYLRGMQLRVEPGRLERILGKYQDASALAQAASSFCRRAAAARVLRRPAGGAGGNRDEALESMQQFDGSRWCRANSSAAGAGRCSGCNGRGVLRRDSGRVGFAGGFPIS